MKGLLTHSISRETSILDVSLDPDRLLGSVHIETIMAKVEQEVGLQIDLETDILDVGLRPDRLLGPIPIKTIVTKVEQELGLQIDIEMDIFKVKLAHRQSVVPSFRL